MSDKVKPWHRRRPKQQEGDKRKRPHLNEEVHPSLQLEEEEDLRPMKETGQWDADY